MKKIYVDEYGDEFKSKEEYFQKICQEIEEYDQWKEIVAENYHFELNLNIMDWIMENAGEQFKKDFAKEIEEAIQSYLEDRWWNVEEVWVD